MTHAHAVDTRPSFPLLPPPNRKVWGTKLAQFKCLPVCNVEINCDLAWDEALHMQILKVHTAFNMSRFQDLKNSMMRRKVQYNHLTM